MSRWMTMLGCLAMGLLGGFLGSLHSPPAQAADSVYRAQRFELVRPDGEVAAVLRLRDNAPELVMYQGKKEAVVLKTTFEGGNLSLDNTVTNSHIDIGNAVFAQEHDHPVRSDSYIRITGRNSDTVWSAP